VAICALLAAACSGGGSGAGGKTATARAALPADLGATNWASYGHDLWNTRLNPNEKTINVGSAGSLGEVWSKQDLIGVTGTPVVADGVAYYGDWLGAVWAVHADTGEKIWSTKVGGQFIGSPAVSGDAVFVGSGKTLTALDEKTGAMRWQAVTNDNAFSQINSSPIVVDGMVIEGTAQFEEVVGNTPFTFRGSIGAWDAATGKQAWNFFTTPNDSTSGAGEGIWGTPAVDTTRGLLYIGTGPNLSQPPGPLADALLAIDYKTGTLKWSHQFNQGDIFSRASNFSGPNADIGASPNLWTAGGRDFVGAGSKNGTYYALDRATGQVVWQTPMTAGGPFGGALGSAAFVDGKVIASSNEGDAPQKKSKVMALDPATGAIRWTVELDGYIFGPVSAAPGVAFVGTDSAEMVGLDVRTGAKVWTFKAPAQVGGGASLVDGRLLWGYGFTLFAGAGKGGIISFAPGAAGSGTTPVAAGTP
jgi:polyvinyl alcohol dehydrogenase (cytochrome)